MQARSEPGTGKSKKNREPPKNPAGKACKGGAPFPEAQGLNS
jgi:hypothetical protein